MVGLPLIIVNVGHLSIYAELKGVFYIVYKLICYQLGKTMGVLLVKVALWSH